ncbi:MAG: polymer-forming cytoskeletal protein [Woeseiaceae bacterium]
MNETQRRRLRDRSEKKATLINQGCIITGSIRGNGNFLINGEVNGDCDIDGTLTLAADSIWRGVIKASSIILSGSVEGDVIARGQVEITSSAKIIGTVSGEAIAVAEGAVIDGAVKTTGTAALVEFVEKRR